VGKHAHDRTDRGVAHRGLTPPSDWWPAACCCASGRPDHSSPV
jgi:hypothetical protein